MSDGSGVPLTCETKITDNYRSGEGGERVGGGVGVGVGEVRGVVGGNSASSGVDGGGGGGRGGGGSGDSNNSGGGVGVGVGGVVLRVKATEVGGEAGETGFGLGGGGGRGGLDGQVGGGRGDVGGGGVDDGEEMAMSLSKPSMIVVAEGGGEGGGGTLDSNVSFKPGRRRQQHQQQQQELQLQNQQQQQQQQGVQGWLPGQQQQQPGPGPGGRWRPKWGRRRRRQQSRDYNDSARDEACGMCGCQPKWMQVFNNPRALLFFLCSGSFIQGFVLNGLNSVNATSLERRFGLSSSNIGMIASVYDISAALFGVLISYLCSRGHKPRCLGISILVMGLGSLVMALPHFTTNLYRMGQENVVDESLCITGNNTGCSDHIKGSGLSWYMYIFLIGQVLNGVGGATLYTVGFACIDDNVSHKRSPVYISILLCLTMVGVAVGYTAGGKLLDYHVDFLYIDSSKITTDPKNPRWVGAWWVGYLVGGIIALIMGPFLLCYPKKLPAKKSNPPYDDDVMKQLQNEDDPHYVKKDSVEDCKVSKEICNLIHNPTFLMVTLGAIAESINVAGFATFLPKFIQNHFHQTASWASMLAGIVVVPAGAAGQLLGGYLSRRLQLHVKGMARMCIITLTLSSAGIAAFWARCDSNLVAGISASYYTANKQPLDMINLTSKCNDMCHCTTAIYEPVCSSDGLQYFSPCHAGCTKISADGEFYMDCTCVDSLASYHMKPTSEPRTVSRHSCQQDCTQLFFFLPAVFLNVFFSFIAQTPFVSMVLRCTDQDRRSFALGLNAFLIRMLGSLPGPLLIGAIIDRACTVWQSTCEGDSSCWIYNDMGLAANLIVLVLTLRLVSIISLFLADRFYKSTPSEYAQSKDGNQLSPTNEIYTESLVIPKRYSVNILENDMQNYNPVDV